MVRVSVLSVGTLDASLATIRSSVIQSGAHFADLTRALRDDQFRDAAGHFTLEGDGNGMEQLARTLARLIRQMPSEGLRRQPRGPAASL